MKFQKNTALVLLIMVFILIAGGCRPKVFTPSDLIPSNFSAPAALEIGQSIETLTLTITNSSSGDAYTTDGNLNVGFYISTNQTFDNSDILLAQKTVTTPIAAKGVVQITLTDVTLPTNVSAGSYYLLAFVDSDKEVSEANESNNIAVRALTITTPTNEGPDLAFGDVILPTSAPKGYVLNSEINVNISNIGTLPTSTSTPIKVAFYISVDEQFSQDDQLAFTGDAMLPSTGSTIPVTFPQDVFVPETIAPGDYNWVVMIDSTEQVTELDESNNTIARTAIVYEGLYVTDDADLLSLELSVGTLSPVFDSAVQIYTAQVANEVTSLTVTARSFDDAAVMHLNGTLLPYGTPSAPLNLVTGDNLLSLVVTAQDGLTQKTYTVTVTRHKSTDATLANLTISNGTLTPAYQPTVFAYSTTVSNAVSTLQVTPTSQHANATITVEGATTLSAEPYTVNLAVGLNQIGIDVTAEDGVTKNHYSIAVTREANTNSALSNLEISTGQLNQSFSSSVLNYTGTVARSMSSITLKPTTADSNATVRVNGTLVQSGTDSAPITLNLDTPTSITILVQAEDGVTTTSYTLNISRAVESAIHLTGLKTDDKGMSGWNSNGTIEPAATGHLLAWTGQAIFATYYISSADYGGYGTTGACGVDALGLPDFESALAENGFTIADLTYHMGLASLGNDLQNADWAYSSLTHTETRYYRGASLTFKLKGEDMVRLNLPTFHCVVKYNDTSNMNDDTLSAYTDYQVLENCSANSSLAVQAVAAALIRELNNVPVRANFLEEPATFQWINDIAKGRQVGIYDVGLMLLELDLTELQ